MPISLNDLRVDTFVGGDKTVRVTHIPTGRVVTATGNRQSVLAELKAGAIEQLEREVVGDADTVMVGPFRVKIDPKQPIDEIRLMTPGGKVLAVTKVALPDAKT